MTAAATVIATMPVCHAVVWSGSRRPGEYGHGIRFKLLLELGIGSRVARVAMLMVRAREIGRRRKGHFQRSRNDMVAMTGGRRRVVCRMPALRGLRLRQVPGPGTGRGEKVLVHGKVGRTMRWNDQTGKRRGCR